MVDVADVLAAGEVPEELVLGCAKCRRSAKGCSQCRNPLFKGTRGPK